MSLVKEALIKAGRTDLIGFEKHCLIPPRKLSGKKRTKGKDGNKKAGGRKKQNH